MNWEELGAKTLLRKISFLHAKWIYFWERKILPRCSEKCFCVNSERIMDILNRRSFIRMVLGNVVTYCTWIIHGCSMNFYFFCIIVAIFSFWYCKKIIIDKDIVCWMCVKNHANILLFLLIFLSYIIKTNCNSSPFESLFVHCPRLKLFCMGNRV
jgi:hypothetical protein